MVAVQHHPDEFPAIVDVQHAVDLFHFLFSFVIT